MAKTLIHRYTYGNFSDLPTFGAESDFFLGGPARERELLALTRAQIALQRDASASYRKVGTEVARLICNELEHQTAILGDILRAGAEQVVSAIDALGDRMSAELSEIRWQVVQLRSTNEQILQVLRRPRSTEAQELIEQGLRNLLNDKLSQAEDRFLRALDLDNTDYQVLMNLGAVEIRKGNSSRAKEYLQDALTLPAQLNAFARAEALWCLARLHYTEADNATAVMLAKRSLDLAVTPRRMLQVGIYLILAHDVDSGFRMIEEAILGDPKLFATIALAPDLGSQTGRLHALLEKLSQQARLQLRSDYEKLLLHVTELRSLPLIPREDSEAFSRQVGTLDQSMAQSTYSQMCQALSFAKKLEGVITGYRELSAAESALSRAREEHERVSGYLKTVEEELARSAPERTHMGETIAGFGCLSALGGAVVGAVVGVGLFNTEALIGVGFIGAPVLVTIWLLAREGERARKAEQVKQARGYEATAASMVAAAKDRRDRARRNAAIPGTGYGAR